MSHAIEFIETPMFTRQMKQIATDEELRELQKTLIEQHDRARAEKLRNQQPEPQKKPTRYYGPSM